ncbi:glutaminyl-peptide cyclotransferase [Mucilaginibacter koreensis]
MKKQFIYALAAIALAGSCKNNPDVSTQIFISPDAGTTYPLGQPVQVKVSYPSSMKVDSVVYFADSARVASGKDSATITLKTDGYMTGLKTITAKLYEGGKPQEVSTNIVLLAAKAPEEYTYQVVKSFPHDTTSFTEGLEYHDGYLYESDGGTPTDGTGLSSLRKVDINTGKAVQKLDGDPKIFNEGITLIDGKLIQLTYKDHVGFVYDAKTFKKLSTFPYQAGAEGWGLCNDGKKLYTTTTGTNQIVILNKDTYQKEGEIDVYDDKGPVNNLNEIELVDGLFYVNIWQTDTIVVVDPKNGAVVRRVNLATLYPEDDRHADGENIDVLNGIAWDAEGKRLFITGKKWPKLYQVNFVKK